MSLELADQTTSFAGLDLLTSRGRVMTPRPASEALVQRALDRLRPHGGVAADVGTGSGALAVALALGAPGAVVWATDVSAHAVALAERNVRRHGVADRVRVRRGDLLEPTEGPLDVVVANLPYLPYAELEAHPELAGEPLRAVFAEGDGLDGYRRLLAQAARRLAPDGRVFLQVRGRVVGADRASLGALAAWLDAPVAAVAAAAR